MFRLKKLQGKSSALLLFLYSCIVVASLVYLAIMFLRTGCAYEDCRPAEWRRLEVVEEPRQVKGHAPMRTPSFSDPKDVYPTDSSPNIPHLDFVQEPLQVESHSSVKMPSSNESQRANPTDGSTNGTKDYLLEEFFRSRQYKDLSPDARLLVQSVIEARFQLVDSPKSLICKGDRQEYEVEDILCVPRPKYLQQLKNPCWWHNSTGQPSLRCLPYFHILGCEKCGTSDLWDRITSHPHAFKIDGIKHKEASWWSWGRYGLMNYSQRNIRNFYDYTASFKKLTRRVEKALLTNTGDPSPFITGDATPSDLTDFRGWVNITQNRGLKHPRVITPHLMKHFYPNPKFIILYRDPVERFYSEYHYINGSKHKDADIFHRLLIKSISMLASCTRAHGLRTCAFDQNMYHALPLRLQFFFYSLYLPEWLKVFPRENFLILKTEEYSKDIKGTLNTCLDFLGLEPLSETAIGRIESQRHSNVGRVSRRTQAMLPASRQILEAMAGPTTRLLADMLADRKFAWYDH